MKERGLAFNFHPPNESRYVAPGVLDTTQTDWFSALAARFDIPFRVHCWEQKPAWLWNRVPLPYVRRGAGYGPGRFDYPNNAIKSLYCIPYGSEPISASDPYSHDFRRRFMENLSRDPNFLGSKAVAEIPNAGVEILAAVAGMPETKAYWHSYLVHVLGLDLPKVGLLHHGRRDFYKSWDQVEVPLPHQFLGLDAESLDLTGLWEGMADRECKGVEAKWYAPETMPPEGWVPVHCNEQMLFMYRGGQHGQNKLADYWLRRTVTLTGSQRGHLRYLYLARPETHGGGRKYAEAYLNGTPLARVSPESSLTIAFALGNAAREGANQLVLRMDGEPPVGPVVLGPLPPRPYPRMTAPENRRWYDATNFSAWLRMRGRADLAGHARGRSEPAAQDDGDDQHARHVHRAVRALRRLPTRHRRGGRLLVPDDRGPSRPQPRLPLELRAGRPARKRRRLPVAHHLLRHARQRRRRPCLRHHATTRTSRTSPRGSTRTSS